MSKEFLSCAILILLIFYLSNPVPYCRVTEKQFSEDEIYNSLEASEIKEITTVLLNVKGTSMIPTIQDNSECLCVKKEKYEINDIIFFFAEINNQFNGISHRIIKIEGDEYYTRGDGNDFIDPPMTKESIVCAIPFIPRYKTLLW